MAAEVLIPLSVSTATAARDSERCRCDEPTPFDEFAGAEALTRPETRRFYDYVTACGGGALTDTTTLTHLYDIWRSLGKHG